MQWNPGTVGRNPDRMVPMAVDPARRDIHGNIAATPVANMLHTVRERKLSGRGTFSRGDERVDLAFRDGQIVHAAASDPDLRLGEFLLGEGILTLDQYRRSVEIMLDSGRRQGEILIGEGWIDDEELSHEIRKQMKRIVYGLMRWTEGSYLYRWTPPLEESILLRTSIYKLILRGKRLESRFSVLRDYLAPWHRIPRLNTNIDLEEAREIRLHDDETRVLAAVDGERDVAAVIRTSELPDLEVMRILYGLGWARILQIVDPDDEPDRDPFDLEHLLA